MRHTHGTRLAGLFLAAIGILLFPITSPAGQPSAAASGASQQARKPCNPRKPACPDVTPPTIAIVSPSPGATVSGLVTVTGTAADNLKPTLVEVQVDDGGFQIASGTSTWTFALDTMLHADGFHVVRARAADAAGNLSDPAFIQLNFDNAGADPNVLVVGEVRVDRPTLHALGVQVLIGGDANRNGRIGVRYRRAGAADWTAALPLMRVMPETIVEPVPEQFAGSLFDLDPATSYEIELRALDADGSVEVVTYAAASTRPVPRNEPVSGRTIDVQDATTFRAALSVAQPGDVILLAPGTYAGPFGIGASGTPDRPVIIRGWSAGDVVLDGNNCGSCNVLEVSGSYVHVERLTIANAFRALRFTGVDATGNVARRLSIRNVVHGTASGTGQTDFYICDNAIDGRLRWPWVFGTDATAHWDDRGIEVTGDGHVVCHNSIRGFGDPVLNMKRRARSWDVYGNDIADAWDGVEIDRGEGNVRLFHNRFTNVMAPVSIQPMYGGPGYALRNVGFNLPDEQVKLKSYGGVEEPSGVLVYHNTFVSPGRALNLLSSITQHNFVFANNLFVGPEVLWGTRSVDWRAGINRGLFDYNGYFPDGDFMFGTVDGIDRLFPSFAGAQAGGVEPHGTLVTSPVFAAGFVGPSDEEVRHDPKEFSLAVGSSAVDRGARLPGINDGFTGSAPDLGALEQGCPVPVYGPRPEGLEGFTWPINCG